MILRRVIAHFRKQEWTAIAIDFVIVVAGVFVGLQVNTWNEARTAHGRREQVKATLLTDLKDAGEVQHDVIFLPVQQGLADWRAAFERGERPPPFFLRMHGSDTAPDTWNALQQEGLSDLFGTATLFDLGFYYSELNGIGRKYIRYVAFVESDILPKLKQAPSVFYMEDGSALKPEYAASMDRLREYAGDSNEMRRWGRCLIYRIEAPQTFDTLCRRSGYRLDGMPAPEESAE